MLRTPSVSSRRGFTMTELLVAIGTIIVLLGILLPALALVRTQAGMAESESNLKQIATWMRMYSTDNREYIVPSQFNYAGSSYPGHVRDTPEVQLGSQNAGTWTDILWTVYGNYSFPQLTTAFGHDYSTDSPDLEFYAFMVDYSNNPFRAAVPNTSLPVEGDGTGATPYGDGITSEEKGMPGYFAANGFFNADATDTAGFNGWYVTGQIKAPSRSVYAIDSFFGEVIDDHPRPWAVRSSPNTCEVDFRYSDSCLMLMLDGSIQPKGKWENLTKLQSEQGIRVTDLTK